MKKHFLFPAIFAFIFIMQTPAKAQDSNAALQYMKNLEDPVNSLKDETWKYLKAITNDKGARKVEAKRQDLLNGIKTTKNEISKIKPFESDETFKAAIVNYLDLSYTVIKQDYDKILNMEEISDQSYDLMEAYILAKEKAGEKLDSVSDLLNEAEKAFAEKYGITLVEGERDKISKKIKKAAEALEYFDKIYLAFFRVYKQEAYVLDAAQKSDVNGIEQNSKSLGEIAEATIPKLNDIGGYKGDLSLKTAAEQMVRFYKEESEKNFPVLIDYYIKKDNFEKVQKVMEAKKQKDRTQQDVDQYNKAVKEYNDAVNSFNKVNESYNARRTKLIEQWNQKQKSFFDTHSN